MPQHRVRDADRLSGSPLQPGPSRARLAVDLGRVLWSAVMMVWGQVTALHAGLIRIKPPDPTWASIGLQRSTDLIGMGTPDSGADHTTGRIHGRPSPPRRRWRADHTPPRLHRRGGNCTKFPGDGMGRAVMPGGARHRLPCRRGCLLPAAPDAASGGGHGRSPASHDPCGSYRRARGGPRVSAPARESWGGPWHPDTEHVDRDRVACQQTSGPSAPPLPHDLSDSASVRRPSHPSRSWTIRWRRRRLSGLSLAWVLKNINKSRTLPPD